MMEGAWHVVGALALVDQVVLVGLDNEEAVG